jgi:hypothetical protein
MSHPLSSAPLYSASVDEAERRAALDARQRELRADARFLCESLRLVRLCPRKACRRADDCRGEPRSCLDTRGEAVPEEARDFARLMLDAEKDRESADDIEADYPEEAAAWRAWVAALDARVRRRR